MKTELVNIEKVIDDNSIVWYRGLVIFPKEPDLMLGECEIKQKKKK